MGKLEAPSLTSLCLSGSPGANFCLLNRQTLGALTKSTFLVEEPRERGISSTYYQSQAPLPGPQVWDFFSLPQVDPIQRRPTAPMPQAQ